MTPLSDPEITRIAQGVLDRSLPKSDWTHQAHFAAALWLIRNQPGFDDARHMPGIIRAYNEEKHIDRLLTGIAQQTVKNVHVAGMCCLM